MVVKNKKQEAKSRMLYLERRNPFRNKILTVQKKIRRMNRKFMPKELKKLMKPRSKR